MVSKITKRTNYKKSYKNKKAKAKKNSRKSKYNRKNVSKKGNYKKNKSYRYSKKNKSSKSSVRKSGKKQKVNKRNMRGGKCRYAIVDEPGFSIDKTVIGEGSIINGLNIGDSKGLVGKFGCDDEISQP
tara:strand:- start:17577 stop:17960 length:384 start_codon:yes stop_codon:yes gene_type:complete